MDSKWRVDLSTQVFLGDSPWDDDIQLHGSAQNLNLTLPRLHARETGELINQFSTLDLQIDPHAADRLPVFLPGPASDQTNALKINVSPAPGAKLTDYIFRRTLGQLAVGQAGYISPEAIIARQNQESTGTHWVVEFQNVYVAQPNKLASVKVTRYPDSLTACMPADVEPGDTVLQHGRSPDPGLITVILRC